MAALADNSSSNEEDYSGLNSYKAPTSMRSREGSVNEHSADNPLGTCGKIFCGGGSSKPHRYVRRVVSDPNS